MLLFSIVANCPSLFLFVAVLALLCGDNVVFALLIVNSGTAERIFDSDTGVLVTPSPAPTPTTGLLFAETLVSNSDYTNITGIGMLVDDGSKLIAYGGSVSSDVSYAVFFRSDSSAAICDGTFTGGTLRDDAPRGRPGDGRSAMFFNTDAVDPGAIIEVKTGTFTGGNGVVGEDGLPGPGGDGLTIAGRGSTGIIIDGMFRGGNSGGATAGAGCGLDAIRGAYVELHGGHFESGSGPSSCSIKTSFDSTIEVFRGTTFDGNWRNGGTIIVHGSSFVLDGTTLDEDVPVGGSGLLTGVLCDDTPISVELRQAGSGRLIFRSDCEEPPSIEDCRPSPSAAPSQAPSTSKSGKSSKSKSTKSTTAKSSKTAKSGASSPKGSKNGKMSSKASSTMRTNGENVFYHANGQVDEGFAMIGANAMGTSSSSSSLLFGTTSIATALKITTSLSVLAMMAFYAY